MLMSKIAVVVMPDPPCVVPVTPHAERPGRPAHPCAPTDSARTRHGSLRRPLGAAVVHADHMVDAAHRAHLEAARPRCWPPSGERPVEPRDSEPPAHLCADGREPRLVAAAQAGCGRPAGAGRHWRDRTELDSRRCRPGRVSGLSPGRTTFVGRRRDHDAVVGALAEARLVSLVRTGRRSARPGWWRRWPLRSSPSSRPGACSWTSFRCAPASSPMPWPRRWA